ncbi:MULTISPECIES: AMP-binding protein [unclassified Mycobacteroides]|uniref:AMP-binding protein n=1 Tax=unclassified Mycobacteroides TaxID=2618759 RepID=UPI0013296021|nr:MULTISPECIES: AMP-binding protein [unclassified Mycobacteroides]MUM20057.1 peptide synthase [Mycobacteroides sp. CBMA 326]
MTAVVEPRVDRVSLSRSQQNIYNGAQQADDPGLYLIGKSYRFHPQDMRAFRAALESTIAGNPVQLCVLEASKDAADYPDLARRLEFSDIVHVASDDENLTIRCGEELVRTWFPDLHGKPLVRYTARIREDGLVVGLDIQAHHLLLDGGAVGVVEADLARHLASAPAVDIPCFSEGMAKLSVAHNRENVKADESLQRFARTVRDELADAARHAGQGRMVEPPPSSAAKGVLRESITLSGKAFDAVVALAESRQVPLNILVAAASVAVNASLQQSTTTLLIHAVDNRFADPDLDVATCLVNSIAHPVRFAAFASVRDVVRALDRDYVRASRRRWLREEQYRRMYLAINRTSHVEALTFNFIRETCAPALRPFLSEAPVPTDIGPVEGMTVSCIVNEDDRALTLSIWQRVDAAEAHAHPWVAERIAAALGSMDGLWDKPIAMAVNEWFAIGPDGALRRGDESMQARRQPSSAWFTDTSGGVGKFLVGRRFVDPWIAWLERTGIEPGDIVVCLDDDTDKTIDLLVASHLAGCGYSVCDSAEEVPLRMNSIAEHTAGVAVWEVDVAAAVLTADLDESLRRLVDQRIDRVAQDSGLATRTAYIMATSGSTGEPKLVPISHGALAMFSDAVRDAYHWAASDTLLQCAPLTSDISVEEIFGAAVCGATLVRSTAVKTGDLDALRQDLVDGPTLIDLPTAVWHLLCEDPDALSVIGGSGIRQVVVGGEAIRPSVVDKWADSVVSQHITLISTYGPTETTVVVSQLPIVCDGSGHASAERLRLGRPILPNTVFIAFGEVVIAGDTVSPGYLGMDSASFGTVNTTDGAIRRAFATADRVVVDEDGFPLFAGRRDAIVKVSGRRVDTAAIVRCLSEDVAVADVGVGVHNGGLVVWFQTGRTREGLEDNEVAVRIRRALASFGVASFFVVGVPAIPRKANGKVDNDSLQTMPQFVDAVPNDDEIGETAAGLARIWSRHLGRPIGADSSLLNEGIGSLDLIKILPDTRKYLGRQLSILDLISADSAAYLAAVGAAAEELASVDAAAEIGADLERMLTTRTATTLSTRGSQDRSSGALVVLGASGIVGTGFARAVLDLKRDGTLRPDVVFATRSELAEAGPWPALRDVAGVRILHMGAGFGPNSIDQLLRDAGARTVVNCIGNTNMLAPYRDVRDANVELVSAAVEACVAGGVRLVHMSTYVVNGDAAVARVTDPRQAVYPYAASKALAELVVAGSPSELDFTLVRLPRVLGEADQLRASADVLVSIVDASIAVRACPSVVLTEEVTTGHVVAKQILGLLQESSTLGRGITVVRGLEVPYTEFLAGYGLEEVDLGEWMRRVDLSEWAACNPRRWSVIDAWAGLGMRLGSRTYAEFLADYPTIALESGPGVELVAAPESLRDLLEHGCSR